MSDSLFSDKWYRVAELHPRLRAQVRVQRQRWRDQRWYVLSDEATGRQHRINDAAYQFIGRCDGSHTVQAVWEAVLEELGDQAPTQGEIVDLLIRLNESELLQTERTPQADGLFHRRHERAKTRRRASVNPLAFRLPLGDPQTWLARLDWLAHLLFRPAVFWLWLVGILLAALAAGSVWSSLSAHFMQTAPSARFLVLTWICFPLIKALHELAHGLAVRRWGGEVHEFGITLLVLVPAPYVDATAASAFLRRRERAIVGAAGIMVELALAAIALAVWITVQPGLVRDVALVAMTIGAVSTLAFNGNPLLRFDAYHVLCDLLDLPNLAIRSSAYWSSLIRRHLLRARAETPEMAQSERKWLLSYAPLSLAYRIVISLGILLWLGSKWFLLGFLAAAYLAIALFARPALRLARQALAAAAPGGELNRVRLALAAAVVVPGLLLFVVPLPFATVSPAVVWLPEGAQVRPEVDGFIRALPVADGEHVQPGEIIAQLDNPDLVAASQRLAGRLDGLRSDHFQMLLRDAMEAQNLAEEISRTEAELARAEQRLAQLEVRAEVGGRLVMPRQSDLPGSFVQQGTTLAYVLEGEDLIVKAAVSQEDAYLVRNRTQAARVRLADHPATELAAQVRADTPASTRDLPSPALGDRAGGPVRTDPADKAGKLALDPVFLFDLALPSTTLERVGGRAWVRFDHGTAPLAMQAYRRASQLFLKHFDPAG